MLGFILHIIWIIIVIMIILWLVELVFGISFFAIHHDTKQEMADVLNFNRMLNKDIDYKSELQNTDKTTQDTTNMLNTENDEENDVQPSSSEFLLNLSKPHEIVNK
ncbi:hypothetical protein BDAP_001448 [Binucleata daphniae]